MPSLPSPEQERIAAEVLATLVEKAPLRRTIQLRWRGFRTTAGLADVVNGVLSLSVHLMTDRERIEATLTHEYAHFIVYEAHGRRVAPHGPAWRAVMVALGQPPTRCHSYEVQRNRSRRLIQYQCRKCGLRFERRRRLVAPSRYRHQGCGGTIEYAGILEHVAPTEGKAS